MNNKDIRWIQRLSNFNKAFAQFSKAIDLAKARELTDLEKQGLIQSFEYTHELAWNVMKDYFLYQGDNSIKGSRDATRSAFQVAIIEDGQAWMDMIESRNQTTHTYNEKTTNDIHDAIVTKYYDAFLQFQTEMQALKRKEENQ